LQVVSTLVHQLVRKGQTYFQSDDDLSRCESTEHMCHVSICGWGDMALSKLITLCSVESSRNCFISSVKWM
jgi:hypothetical protein